MSAHNSSNCKKHRQLAPLAGNTVLVDSNSAEVPREQNGTTTSVKTSRLKLECPEGLCMADSPGAFNFAQLQFDGLHEEFF